MFTLSSSVYTEEIRPTLYYSDEQVDAVFFWMHFPLHLAINVKTFCSGSNVQDSEVTHTHKQ